MPNAPQIQTGTTHERNWVVITNSTDFPATKRFGGPGGHVYTLKRIVAVRERKKQNSTWGKPRPVDGKHSRLRAIDEVRLDRNVRQGVYRYKSIGIYLNQSVSRPNHRKELESEPTPDVIVIE